jgi:hypothetical protein
LKNTSREYEGGRAVMRIDVMSGSKMFDAGAILAIMHTPPQIDRYTSKNRRAGVVGKRRRGTLTPSVTYRLFHISPSKKAIVCSCQALVAEHGGALAVKTPFRHALAEYTYCKSSIFPPKSLLCFECYPRAKTCSSWQSSLGVEDVQTYFCPIDMHRRSDDRRKEHCIIVLETQCKPIAEGGQKKDGNRPKPEKPKPDKSKTGPPEREGDKGSQRVKRPKRDGLAFSLRRRGLYGLVIVLRWIG